MYLDYISNNQKSNTNHSKHKNENLRPKEDNTQIIIPNWKDKLDALYSLNF